MSTKNILGKTDLEVPIITLGTWKLGELDDDAQIENVMTQALLCGVCMIDTSPTYGSGRIDKILFRLKKVFPHLQISTKIPGILRPTYHTSAEKIYPSGYITKKSRQMLSALGISTVDLLQLHNWRETWDDGSISKIVTELRLLKKEGRTKAIGISLPSDTKSYDDRLLDLGLDFLQVHVSLCRTDALWKFIPSCYDAGIGILARSVLEGGTLSVRPSWRTHAEQKQLAVEVANRLGIPLDRISSYSIRFVTDNPHVSSTIVGMNSCDSIEATLAALKNPIDQTVFDKIDWKHL